MSGIKSEKKKPQKFGAFFIGSFWSRLNRFHNFARLETLCAYLDSPHLAINAGANLLQIRQPAALTEIVSVADSMAPHRLLATKITTLCHCFSSR